MKSWATADWIRSGKAHYWREAANEPRICFSECGLQADAASLQAERESFGRALVEAIYNAMVAADDTAKKA